MNPLARQYLSVRNGGLAFWVLVALGCAVAALLI